VRQGAARLTSIAPAPVDCRSPTRAELLGRRPRPHRQTGVPPQQRGTSVAAPRRDRALRSRHRSIHPRQSRTFDRRRFRTFPGGWVTWPGDRLRVSGSQAVSGSGPRRGVRSRSATGWRSTSQRTSPCESATRPSTRRFISLAEPSGRYLSFAEREEIALLRAQDYGVREIARKIGRDASTISRELRRNAASVTYRHRGATSACPPAPTAHRGCRVLAREAPAMGRQNSRSTCRRGGGLPADCRVGRSALSARFCLRSAIDEHLHHRGVATTS